MSGFEGKGIVIDNIKDILVFVLSDQDRSAVQLARKLALRNEAHLSAVFLEPARDPLLLFEGMDLAYASGAWMNELPDAEPAPSARQMMHWRFRAMLRGAAVRERECGSIDESAVAVQESRYADVVVLSRPESGLEAGRRQRLLGSILLDSGRPILLVPANWTHSCPGRRIAIAWNGRREAVHALAEAHAFLRQADQITIITVEENGQPDSRDSATRTAQHLARRGLKSQVRLATRNGRSTERTLLDECAALDADLIVMGGYGGARISELVFGGVTRNMLQASPVPVFVAH